MFRPIACERKYFLDYNLLNEITFELLCSIVDTHEAGKWSKNKIYPLVSTKMYYVFTVQWFPLGYTEMSKNTHFFFGINILKLETNKYTNTCQLVKFNIDFIFQYCTPWLHSLHLYSCLSSTSTMKKKTKIPQQNRWIYYLYIYIFSSGDDHHNNNNNTFILPCTYIYIVREKNNIFVCTL